MSDHLKQSIRVPKKPSISPREGSMLPFSQFHWMNYLKNSKMNYLFVFGAGVEKLIKEEWCGKIIIIVMWDHADDTKQNLK